MLYIRSSYASLLMPHCPVTVVQRYRDGVCSLLFHLFFHNFPSLYPSTFRIYTCFADFWLCRRGATLYSLVINLRWPVRAVFTSKLHTSKFHIVHFQIPHCTLTNSTLHTSYILQVGKISTQATVDTTNSRDGLSGVLSSLSCAHLLR